MTIKSAGTYMQISDLCKSCSKQNFCGNGMTNHYCTGYAPITYQYHTDIIVPPFTEEQKKIIEATERIAKECDDIKANVNKWGRKNICDIDDDIDEQTNEEWIRSCSTEELAEILFQVYVDGRYDATSGDWEGVDTYVEWLKEVHKE